MEEREKEEEGKKLSERLANCTYEIQRLVGFLKVVRGYAEFTQTPEVEGALNHIDLAIEGFALPFLEDLIDEIEEIRSGLEQLEEGPESKIQAEGR